MNSNTKRRGNPKWSKGGSGEGRGRGRPKGAKNKLHADVITDILEIVAKLSKEKGKSLYDCSRDDPVWFYETFYKALIPKNVQVSGEMQFEVSIPGVSISLTKD